MADQKYFAVVTDIGIEKIAKAVATGEKVNITTFAVGDSGGTGYDPTPDMTALKNEKWRGAIGSLNVNSESQNVIDISAIVPADVGGWTIREGGLFDDEGDMIAICNTPDTAKVIISSGAAGQVSFKIHVVIENTDSITLLIDPNIITASKQYVDLTINAHNTDPVAHAGMFASQAQLDAHTAKTDIHTTSSEKTAITGHISDAGIHVTQTDKDKWNAGGGGKQYSTFVIGHANSGHTANEVDYLCDGTADQVEIQAAIDALPVNGGQVLILEGTYHITAGIKITTDNVALAGMGASTKLVDYMDQSQNNGFDVISISGSNCKLEKLRLEHNDPVNTNTQTGGYWAMAVYGGSNISISGNVFRSYNSGIKIATTGLCVGIFENVFRPSPSPNVLIYSNTQATLIIGNSCDTITNTTISGDWTTGNNYFPQQ